MNKKKFFTIFGSICLGLIIAALPFISACATPTPTGTMKLRWASVHGLDSFPDRGVVRHAAELERRSNGRITFEMFRGGSLLTPKDAIDGIIAGTADIGTTIIAISPGRFPLLSGIDLPVGFSSAKVANLVFWDLFKKFDPEEMKNLKVLTVFTAPPANIFSKVPVRTLDDIQGLELRGTGAGAKVLEMLGGVPVAMPQEETYEAMAKGIVKGNFTSFDVLQSMNQAEHVNYATWTYMQTASFVTVMNLDVWNSLPLDIQKIFDDMAVDQAIWTGEDIDNENMSALQWSVDNYGVEVINLSAAEQARFEERVKPMVDKWIADTEAKGLPGQEFMDELIRLKKKHS